MGMDITAITFVGREFKNEAEGLAFFRSKVELTEDDLDEMGPHLHYWMEPRIKDGYPECRLYSILKGIDYDGYYIGYSVYDNNPQVMKENIDRAVVCWENLFKEKAEVIQAVLYS